MLLQNAQCEFVDFLLSDERASDMLDGAQNIGIYRRTVSKSLLHVLQSIYPLVERLVGNDFFYVAAKEYVRQYPSRSSNLNDYGQFFSDFLAHYPPVKSLIYLSEVAAFEWMCHQLKFAASSEALNIERLTLLSAKEKDEIHFQLHPASYIVKFHFPILHIVELCKAKVVEEINLHQEGVNLLIFRPELEIQLIPLSLADFTFLSTMQEGKNLLQALETTLLIDPQFKLDERLPKWIQDKLIVDFI